VAILSAADRREAERDLGRSGRPRHRSTDHSSQTGRPAGHPADHPVLALARGFFQVVQAKLINRIGNRVVGDMQVRLFGRLIRADLARLRGAHSGSYVSSVLYDAGLIREAATSGIVNYVREGLTIVWAFWNLFHIDPILAGGVLIIAPLAALIMRNFSKRTTKAAKGAMSETSNLSTAIMESLDGVKIVKMENREAYEVSRVETVVERRQRHLIKGSNARALAAPATETFTQIVVAGHLPLRGLAGPRGRHHAGSVHACSRSPPATF
jgi:subfamily B ATP-binding cassette protein MsbA